MNTVEKSANARNCCSQPATPLPSNCCGGTSKTPTTKFQSSPNAVLDGALAIRSRRDEDLPAVLEFLKTANLPADGLQQTDGWVLEENGRLLGHVALERTTDAAVIRSLVVDASQRGRGLGRLLLAAAETAAGDLPRVLRTDTINAWVERYGYRLAQLKEVPPGIRATSQFSGELCASTPVYIKHTATINTGCGCTGSTKTGCTGSTKTTHWNKAWLSLALLGAVVLFQVLPSFSSWFSFQWLGLTKGTHLGEAVAFFVYDAPKVLLLLTLVVFFVTFAQTWIRPEFVRDHLAKRGGVLGSLLAALLGMITPFCSCSAVPLFIGFVRAGVPLGATLAFLVSSPMVNEVALFLLLGLFGWKIALLYASTGISVAFITGILTGRMKLERYLEPWVLETSAPSSQQRQQTLDINARLDTAVQGVRDVVGKVWPYVLMGIGVGAFIHGYAPESVLASFMGKGSWWTVPLAVLIGVPLYASAATIIPVAQVLLAKGAALGTVLAFMMAVSALSLPEAIILRRVLKPQLISIFFGTVALGILTVGYLFNAVL